MTPRRRRRSPRRSRRCTRRFGPTSIQPFLAAWRQYIYRLSVTLLTTARAHAARERRRGNTLNYGDLLQLAARVLRGNAEVRRALQGKYRWLFVDEFQDTDPVQAEIIFLLAGEDAGSAGGRTRRRGRPGRLALDTAPSRRAVRRRRSQAVDLPFPSRGHRHLQRRSRSADRSTFGPGAVAHHELPVRARPVRVGERRVSAAVSVRADGALAEVRAARRRTRAERREGRRIRRPHPDHPGFREQGGRASRRGRPDCALHPVRGGCRAPVVRRLSRAHTEEKEPRVVCRGA